MATARSTPLGAVLQVRRVTADPAVALDRTRWPGSLPSVRQVLDEGLDLGRLTVLVGENGSGKSTLVEAIAQAYGMNAEGGSTGAQHSSRATESDLHSALALTRGLGARRWGFFLRAETMHGFYSYLEDNPTAGPEARYHHMSHGESFLTLLAERTQRGGLYLLDEPESALSVRGCLALVELLGGIAASPDKQAVVATHSPIVAATPGARILELGDDGLVERDWADLDLVRSWRSFLDRPDRYLRHLAGG